MKVNYNSKFKGQDIDIDKLRPGKSYDYLIENRNSSLRDVIANPEKLEKFLIKRACPVCGSSEYTKVINKDNLDIVQCNICSVVYVNPIFDNQKYIEIYQSDDYQQIVKKLGEESHVYRRDRFGKERMDFIEKYHNDKLPKSYMDVGCSTGFILEEARERGWKTLGLELNPSAAKFAESRGLEIIKSPLEEIKFEEKYAAISLFDVLEHLANPKETLQIANDLLMTGGNIYIYVPNYDSAYKELAGIDNSHFIWPTHHLTYFTPETLKHFLEDNGFEVFHWETQGLDIYDWLWYINEKTNYDTKLIEEQAELLQFYINSAGRGKNLRMYAKKK
jgi:SAM-dependent methyltransferase